VDEAIAEDERARALDPLSRIIGTTTALDLIMAGQVEEALRVLRATLELDPNFAQTYEAFCRLHLRRHEAREAVTACERAAALSGRNLGVGYLALAYTAAGDTTRAAAVIRELEVRAQREYVAPTRLAQGRFALGDTTATLAWLERAVAARDGFLITDVLPDPLWDPLRTDPRFTQLRAQMGLAP
jgi:predicted Zn-dependent protease